LYEIPKDKIVAGVSGMVLVSDVPDNATNVLASWTALGIESVRCAGHLLNLIAKTMLDVILSVTYHTGVLG
jgi:hypothetical protein